MKVRYSDASRGSSIELRTNKYSIHMEIYKWYELPDEVVADLRSHYKTLLEHYDQIYFDPTIFTQSGLHIAFRRTFALGDLLMFIPVIKWLNRNTHNRYTLLTQDRFVELFKKFGLFDNVLSIKHYSPDMFTKVIYLDGVLECDHQLDSDCRFLHRTKLYERYLGIQIDKYDWNVNIC